MTDPTSFSTALWTMLTVSAVVVAFGLAALSDMVMRRREDRAERTTRADRTGGHRRGSVRPQDPSHQRGSAHWQDSTRWQDSVASVNGHDGGASDGGAPRA
ncbi:MULTISPECIES: histidine kinase [Nocardiopsis]|uniref:histidine kinase n=1 Tax=Nocardiopsis TaxID=2013 RepID=UPI001F1E8B7B|nr:MULTISPECIES: histidine kinase [Nocardiopsis]